MSTETTLPRLPKHIAIIMDGNGRWAQARKRPRVFGHKHGVDAVRRAVEDCIDRQIKFLTLYAFSSENWNRPSTEVKVLMELLASVLQNDLKRLHQNGVRLNIIGDISRFGARLQKQIIKGVALTENNTAMTLTLAINYGSRWEILQAARQLAEQAKAGDIEPEDISESDFQAQLATADLPDPDLLIRTSGEIRISNFLLWQIAYTELYFTELYWPDFNADALDLALSWYASRQRRFGKTGEQVSLATEETQC